MWDIVSVKTENRTGKGSEIRCNYFLKGKTAYLKKLFHDFSWFRPIHSDWNLHLLLEKIIFHQITNALTHISGYKPVGVYASGSYMWGNRVETAKIKVESTRRFLSLWIHNLRKNIQRKILINILLKEYRIAWLPIRFCPPSASCTFEAKYPTTVSVLCL